MIFEESSSLRRSRVSFARRDDPASAGSGLLLRQEEVGIGTREPVEDIARVLSGMCDAIMARTFEHEKITGLAQWATVPVINGLTDFSHPCQAMADLMTLREHFGEFKEGPHAGFRRRWKQCRKICMAVACAKFDMEGSSSPRPADTNCRRPRWTGSWPRCRTWIGNW